MADAERPQSSAGERRFRAAVAVAAAALLLLVATPGVRAQAGVAQSGAGVAAPAPGVAPADTAAAAPPDAKSAELLREVRIEARTSPDTLTVGDRMTLELRVDAPQGAEVRFPQRVEPGGPVDLLDLKVESPQTKGKSRGATTGPGSWVGRYTLAVFRVGDIVLPPWPVEVRCNGASAIATSDSIRFSVHSVLSDSLRQAKLRDIKQQVQLPVVPWLWIAIGLALVALVAYFWWRRRRRPRAAVVPIERVRPAHELALEALRRLESQHLPLDGKFEAYYVRLSEIFRRYLEDGFGVAALEETTEEILFDLERHGFDRTTVKQIGALCGESDLVKFAKQEPTIQACTESIGRVRDFVLGSAARAARPEGEPAAASGTAGPAGTRPPGTPGAPRAGAGTPSAPRAGAGSPSGAGLGAGPRGGAA